MSQTLGFQKGVWTDLYSLFGITTGNKLLVTNLSGYDILLTDGATAPSDSDVNVGVPIISKLQKVNDFGDVGAWAICVYGGGRITVADLGNS